MPFCAAAAISPASMCWWTPATASRPTDDPALDALGQAAVSHQIVLTKCDEVKPSELGSRIAEVEAALAKRPAAFPDVLATSSRDGAGIPELRAAIARLLAERRPLTHCRTAATSARTAPMRPKQ